MNIAYSQQGDVILLEEDFQLKGLKKVPGDLLHKGQQHHHRLKGGSFAILTDGKDRFVNVTKATKLTHEEHKPISLAKGKYRLRIVMERDHFLEESRQVID